MRVLLVESKLTMNSEFSLNTLQHYELNHITGVEFLGNAGGFSGAAFWRCRTPRGDYCLRRWPTGTPTPWRLRFIHAVLDHASRHGISYVPNPIITRSGQSFVDDGQRLWELTPWLPGAADFLQRPSSLRLQKALAALARFHIAVASHQSISAESPGIRERLVLLTEYRSATVSRIESAMRRGSRPAWEQRAERILDYFRRRATPVAAQLQALVGRPVRLQPCIRDVWSAHILFSEDEVTGIVDFGALRTETVAGDVARLLGSLAGNEDEAWHVGLDSYQAIRPLDQTERELVDALDASTVLLAGLNWLKWIYIDGREFEDWKGVRNRLDTIIGRFDNPTDDGPFVLNPAPQPGG